MEEALPRPAFGRTKHVLAEEAQLDAFPNDRFHYSLLDFLQKRRGGGGASRSSGSSSAGGSSAKSPSKPSAPKSGRLMGGSAPSKPKSPVKAPAKAPKLPTLPKPKSGWKRPKGSLPGYTPGHPPHHGSGGHLPVGGGGGQSHDHDRASSVRSCIHPKGLERLRCEKADAVIGTIFAIIAIMLLPLLIYLCIRYCKHRWSTRKNTYEEDGMELTRGATHCDPSPQISRDIVDGAASNIGLALSTSEEIFALAKEQTQDQSLGPSRGRKLSLGHQPRTRSVSRGRKPFRYAHSIRSVTSSLSSGMIRTAMVGQALQDPTIIDVPPSLASSRKNSERMCSVSDFDRSSDCSPRGDGGRHTSKEERREFVDNDAEGDNRKKEAESRSRFPGRRSSWRGPSNQPENNAAIPGDRASEHSVSRPSSPACCNEEDDLYFSPSSET